MSDAWMENEVIRRWQQQMPMRRIAAELRISRYLVKRIVLDQQNGRAEGMTHPDLPTPPESRGSILDGHIPFVQDLLTRWPSITALRIHEELRGRGFTGKYTIVKDMVRRLRPKSYQQPVVRFETDKGQQSQMDYATYEIDFTEEGRRRVNLFSYVLGYSRRQYLHFVESQDFETTMREHVRAFQHLGGVAATCLYDNMKVVVARYEGDEPIYNTRFLAFATHYGYKVWACRRRRPQTKGKCERPFRYVEGNFLNGRSFRNLEHLVGNVPQSGPEFRLRESGTLRGLLVTVGRTHLGGPGPAQNAAGIPRRPPTATLARNHSGPAGSVPSNRRLRTTLSLSAGAARQ